MLPLCRHPTSRLPSPRAGFSAVPTAAVPAGVKKDLVETPGANSAGFLGQIDGRNLVYRQVQNGRVSNWTFMELTIRRLRNPTLAGRCCHGSPRSAYHGRPRRTYRYQLRADLAIVVDSRDGETIDPIQGTE